jgi:protein-S-isoprenylcysteine O-methyltransferase Ste14
MNLASVESIIRWLGGLLAYTTLGVIFCGIWRGARRRPGRVTGKVGKFFQSLWFFLISALIYIGICLLGWVPLPLNLSPQARLWALVLGSILYFPGMSLALWGRLALGKNYFVSSGFGAQLFTGHQLVVWGPFAIVRHPMYLGVILAAAGSLLIYFTWTTVLFVAFAPLLIVRSRREEAVLASEFAEQWQKYCRRVPAFFPRFRKERTL